MAIARKTLSTLAAIAALAAACAAAYFLMRHAAHHGGHAAAGSLTQTLLRVERPAMLGVPALAATDGQPFTAARLQGRWSVLFFGFTHCPDVCPTTLQVLAAFMRHAPAVEAATKPQIVFVSTDPERDDVARMRRYLENFAAPILGVTGSRENIDRFTAGVGAGARREGGVMDHSTSLFVVDPGGRLVAVLLHPGDPAAIAADLARLRRDPPEKHASLAP